jgi:CheY-like chemotaxis protein
MTSSVDKPLQGVRVLVVDDNPDQLEILRGLLGHAGALVSVAHAAQEAFDSFQADHPDVVVSDLAMPGITGYSLIRRIRASRAGQNVPVIAITAFYEDEHREKALAAGFTAWLAKPVANTVVGEIVRVMRRQ